MAFILYSSDVLRVSNSDWFQEKKKEESSDEMSPPSSMDTSSESESDIPLNQLLKKHQARKTYLNQSPEKSESKTNIKEEVREIQKPLDLGESNSSEEKKTKPCGKDSTKKKSKTDEPKETPLVSTKSPQKETRAKLNECEKTNLTFNEVKCEKSNDLRTAQVQAEKELIIRNKGILGSRSNLNPVVMIEKYNAPEVIEIEDDSDNEALSERFKKEESVKERQLEENILGLDVAQKHEDIKEMEENSKEVGNKFSEKSVRSKNVKRKKQAKTNNRRKSKLKSENMSHGVIEIEDSS